jgi:hypothetical protein
MTSEHPAIMKSQESRYRLRYFTKKAQIEKITVKIMAMNDIWLEVDYFQNFFGSWIIKILKSKIVFQGSERFRYLP